MLEQAWKLARWPAFISVFVTLARFFSERLGLPSGISFFIGIFWLTLFVGIYFGVRFSDEERPHRPLLLSLVVFAFLSRLPVIILWWVTKTFGLGTHYDVFDGWIQVLGAQWVIGVALQVICGGITGFIALYLKKRLTEELP
jgi:hypothetical protein